MLGFSVLGWAFVSMENEECIIRTAQVSSHS